MANEPFNNRTRMGGDITLRKSPRWEGARSFSPRRRYYRTRLSPIPYWGTAFSDALPFHSLVSQSLILLLELELIGNDGAHDTGSGIIGMISRICFDRPAVWAIQQGLAPREFDLENTTRGCDDISAWCFGVTVAPDDGDDN